MVPQPSNFRVVDPQASRRNDEEPGEENAGTRQDRNRSRQCSESLRPLRPPAIVPPRKCIPQSFASQQARSDLGDSPPSGDNVSRRLPTSLYMTGTPDPTILRAPSVTGATVPDGTVASSTVKAFFATRQGPPSVATVAERAQPHLRSGCAPASARGETARANHPAGRRNATARPALIGRRRRKSLGNF